VIRFGLIPVMKLLALTALFLPLVAAQNPGSHEVRGVSYSVDGETTLITVEVSGDFGYVTERLHKPERVYFDIPRARPRINSRVTYSKDFDDILVRRVRVAETAPDVTRVVLDLLKPVDISVSKLSDPARLRIALRPALAERGKLHGVDLISTDSPGQDVVRAKPELTQVLAPDPAPSAVAAESRAKLTLSVSTDTVAPGGAATIVVSLNSSTDNEPVALQWQLSYPSPQIGIDNSEITADEAAKSADKTVGCEGKPEGPGTYRYTCIVSGGTKRMHSGAVALIPLRVRNWARMGTVTVVLTDAISVDSDTRARHLADTMTSLEIR
jgi:hypothetical protein